MHRYDRNCAPQLTHPNATPQQRRSFVHGHSLLDMAIPPHRLSDCLITFFLLTGGKPRTASVTAQCTPREHHGRDGEHWIEKRT